MTLHRSTGPARVLGGGNGDFGRRGAVAGRGAPLPCEVQLQCPLRLATQARARARSDDGGWRGGTRGLAAVRAPAPVTQVPLGPRMPSLLPGGEGGD